MDADAPGGDPGRASRSCATRSPSGRRSRLPSTTRRPSCGSRPTSTAARRAAPTPSLHALYELAARTDCVVEGILDNAARRHPADPEPRWSRDRPAPEPLRLRHEPRLVRPDPAGDRRQARGHPRSTRRCCSSTPTSSASPNYFFPPNADPSTTRSRTRRTTGSTACTARRSSTSSRRRASVLPRRAVRLLRDRLRRHRPGRRLSTPPG